MSDTARGHETVHERNRFLRAIRLNQPLMLVRVTEQQQNMTSWARTLLYQPQVNLAGRNRLYQPLKRS